MDVNQILLDSIESLRSEVKELRTELHEIKSKMQLGKGVILGAAFVVGCAIFGFKTMVFKWLGWG